jgi:hypothetical protein
MLSWEKRTLGSWWSVIVITVHHLIHLGSACQVLLHYLRRPRFHHDSNQMNLLPLWLDDRMPHCDYKSPCNSAEKLRQSSWVAISMFSIWRRAPTSQPAARKLHNGGPLVKFVHGDQVDMHFLQRNTKLLYMLWLRWEVAMSRMLFQTFRLSPSSRQFSAISAVFRCQIWCAPTSRWYNYVNPYVTPYPWRSITEIIMPEWGAGLFKISYPLWCSPHCWS